MRQLSIRSGKRGKSKSTLLGASAPATAAARPSAYHVCRVSVYAPAVTRTPRSIDWEDLAEALDAIVVDGRSSRSERGGDALARLALARLLGDAACREAVDHYVDHRPGSELARSVLSLLRPTAAIDRCLAIGSSDDAVERRRAAIELLSVIADRRVLPFVRGFLDDPDSDIPSWGAEILDQLLSARLVELEEIEPLLAIIDAHPNPAVRRIGRLIRELPEKS